MSMTQGLPGMVWCDLCSAVHAASTGVCKPGLGSRLNPLFCTECGGPLDEEEVGRALDLIGYFDGRCTVCLDGVSIVVKSTNECYRSPRKDRP